MKKYIISLLALIAVGQLYPLTKAEVALKLTNIKLVSTALKDASAKMVGPSTQIMFDSGKYPINLEGNTAWVFTIESLRKLMNQYNVKKNQLWDNYFRSLEFINLDLSRVILRTYHRVFKIKSTLTSEERLSNAEIMKEQFNSIIARISTITQAVTKRSSKSVQEAMIKDIIFQFGLQLRTIASSAIYGIDFAE